MKKYKRSSYLVGAALATSLLLAACTDDSDVDNGEDAGTEDGGETGEEAVDEPQEGGDLSIALAGEPDTVDPHGTNDNQSAKARTLIYETLVNQNPETLELETTGLADSYEQLDETTWEFELHEGIQFHNGEELTADDVVATFDRVLDEEFASEAIVLFEMIEDVEAIDAYTVQFNTEFPFAPLAAHLAHNAAGIISEQAIEEDEAGEQNLDIETDGGTGPFEFEEWNQGSSMAFTKNENYWGEEANLDSVTYDMVDEDLTRISMLDNNETHVADLIQPNLVNQVEQAESASLLSVPSLSMTYVGLNTNAEPLDDPLVRQAVTLAIDNDTLVEGIYSGYADPAYGPINDLVFGYDDNIDALGYDPAQAEALLEEAGYEDGFEATLATNDDNPLREQTAELVQDELSDVGIDLSIENVEWGAFLEQSGEGAFDMFVLGWGTVTGDADYTMYSLFHSDNMGAAGNRSFYDNEEADELIIEAREEPDDDTREELYAELQKILVEDAPMIYTAFDDHRVGVSDSVENFVHHTNGTFDLSETYITEEAEGGY
ncbi:ABC transporter substrate-binding protein [Salicibibacter kimchii]|uniref:Glutathione ABC transporter substrate-binding protein n=1 Tax=Salicibibacter kimchii TaxID=2099786 RepID=A0A345BXH6_9BACI|nr:ABC transporter substrate-binding protein [Salicibibacter kimchii]AXF55657.1 glutathione ABC transporter substrate-binding protein [Salicibibacter kimchii]